MARATASSVAPAASRPVQAARPSGSGLRPSSERYSEATSGSPGGGGTVVAGGWGTRVTGVPGVVLVPTVPGVEVAGVEVVLVVVDDVLVDDVLVVEVEVEVEVLVEVVVLVDVDVDVLVLVDVSGVTSKHSPTPDTSEPLRAVP